MSTNNDFYIDYEGEPEIVIKRIEGGGREHMLSLWSGFFGEIMNLIKPAPNGWTGLVYYYHMQEGWYEESPWELKNIQDAITQLKKINELELCDKSKLVLKLIFNELENASRNGDKIEISYN